MKKLHLLLLLFISLTACSGNATEELPTLVALSTAEESPVFESVPTTTTAAPSTLTAPALTMAMPLSTTPPLPSFTADAARGTVAQGNPTLTFTPSRTITNTRTPTLTLTLAPTQEPGGLEFLVTLAGQATILPPTYFVGLGTPAATGVLPPPAPAGGSGSGNVTCPTPPTGGFGTLFTTDPSVREQLGCPLSTTNLQQNAAVQNFQYGFMVWMSGVPGYVYAFYPNGTYTRYFDTFVEGVDPVSGGEVPPSPDLFEPVRGFGKVWRSSADIRNTLGWATGGESSGTSTTLDFQKGTLLHVNTRGDILVLTQGATADSGTWRSAPGSP